MPIPRSFNGALRNLPKHLSPENLEILNSPPEKGRGKEMEAAWEDASCIDGAGGSQRVNHSDRLAGWARSLEKDSGKVEDRFEMDALRRQVEQLQMALQLQSQQRELMEEIALTEQQNLRRRPSQMQQQPLQPRYRDQWNPPESPVGAMSNNTNPALRAALLDISHNAAASMLLNTQREAVHLPPPQDFPIKQSYYDRPDPRMYMERRPSDFSLSQTSSSPSLSASQSLVEEKKIEDLNRKVEALQLMIEAMNNTTSSASVAHSDTNSAFKYNPTRERLVSSASTVTSTTPSTTTPATAKKQSKLAAVLGLKKAASSSTLDASTKEGEESRVSWSRKRTEKVAVPKVKIRQAAGRGRMVIKEKPEKAAK